MLARGLADSAAIFQRRADLHPIHKEPVYEEGSLVDEQGRELIKLRRGGFAPKLREVKVVRENMPTSVKKLVLLTQLIRNRTVDDALLQLRFARPIKSADVMQQLQEGVKRAEEAYGLSSSQLRVAVAMCNRGSFLKRLDIKGRGRSGMIKRPSTHLTLVLREIDATSQDPWQPKGFRKKGFRAKVKAYKNTVGKECRPAPQAPVADPVAAEGP